MLPRNSDYYMFTLSAIDNIYFLRYLPNMSMCLLKKINTFKDIGSRKLGYTIKKKN